MDSVFSFITDSSEVLFHWVSAESTNPLLTMRTYVTGRVKMKQLSFEQNAYSRGLVTLDWCLANVIRICHKITIMFIAIAKQNINCIRQYDQPNFYSRFCTTILAAFSNMHKCIGHLLTCFHHSFHHIQGNMYLFTSTGLSRSWVLVVLVLTLLILVSVFVSFCQAWSWSQSQPYQSPSWS